ncbi:hypothetical protein FGO68_gene9243 [Halteria grandinella]|uniref:Uncharacterized protein n=1 Tax=Halteria grandinella TaxID=5974 RepID=A0A8J8SXD0_HALGN|nr:hypothetical protein FGO68_gene9243 [Halteria grandinella]
MKIAEFDGKLNLNKICIDYSDIRKLDIILTQMVAKEFGNVTIKICTNFQIFNEYCSTIFTLLKNVFNQSQKANYEVDLFNNGKTSGIQEKRVQFKHYLTNQLSRVTLLCSESIFLSVEILHQIKVLNLYQKENNSFNLIFEKLDTLYPDTQFEINFNNTSYSCVEQIYQIIPYFFDAQCCKIISTSFIMDNEEFQKNLKFKNRFPKNLIQFKPAFSNIFDLAYPD